MDPLTEQLELVFAFAELRPRIERYLRARGGGDETDDLLQDMWLKLRSVEVDQVAEPRSYLYRMAHNLLLDRMRERVRRVGREQVFHETIMGDAAAGQPAMAERALIARARLAMIDETLAALGPRTDMIFRRHRIERVPQRELARQLGVTLSTVEKHLQKAYRAVAAIQSRYLEEDAADQAVATAPNGR